MSIFWEKKAPAGTLVGAPNSSRRIITDSMSLGHKNQESVFSKNRIAYFEKNIQKDPTPDFGLLVKLSDGKCNNSPLMNSFRNLERANLN